MTIRTGLNETRSPQTIYLEAVPTVSVAEHAAQHRLGVLIVAHARVDQRLARLQGAVVFLEMLAHIDRRHVVVAKIL